MKTPVALLIFNRPDKTEKVLEVIRQIKPRKLLVVADGPRQDHPSDAERCKATRAVIDTVDWYCEVLKNYSDTNLGCGLRPATGISWVFEQVEEAIILEDDCLPHPTFFRYCDELLALYRDEEKIMHIAGTNILPDHNKQYSYLYSRLVPIWGWATWRRAWKYFNFEMQDWPDYKLSSDFDYFGKQKENVYKVFEDHYSNQISDSWDARWAFSCTVNHGISIIPKTNLIQNIGFGNQSTHTAQEPSWMRKLSCEEMKFPLKHPDSLQPNQSFDQKYLELMNSKEKLAIRLQRLIERKMKSFTGSVHEKS
jgi:hypothetical protein